ncbi:hypothetical protein GCM10011352_37370 [Marinobacterium zhoushanense]|uniref:N-acetyltransferase domain-containing protein n=1 Tax=Marinobacterium zhoushanense TaxID=1679163 RepID=A0ABQ1KTV4_9GAMM|nr:GNAT family N-acetyltransferase [Marinobacterium zhoushanense]GGC07624.1 hypothetical protein GCM10011352_37370 [Marinobacterium zhoushanense]
MRPIKFERYGIRLESLDKNDIEMVRQWRNDPKISSLMLNQEYISSEMQQLWFERIRRAEDQCYMLAYFKGEPIGAASLIAIDPEAGSCEPGLYVYVDKYRNNIVPFCMAFALNDLAFEVFGMNRLYANVLDGNDAALRFNETMGYQRCSSDIKGVSRFRLEHEAYLAARDKIARFIRY